MSILSVEFFLLLQNVNDNMKRKKNIFLLSPRHPLLYSYLITIISLGTIYWGVVGIIPNPENGSITSLSLSPQDWDVKAYRSAIGHTHFYEVMYTEQCAVHSAQCALRPQCVSAVRHIHQKNTLRAGRVQQCVSGSVSVRRNIHNSSVTLHQE